MKRIKFIFNCLTWIIKKKIFKSRKTDISHECKNVYQTDEDIASIEELKSTEDYAIDYNVTTRWQTV